MTEWADVLDALDAAAACLEAVAHGDGDHGALPDLSFMHDPPREPLPAELGARAAAVFERLRTAEEALRARRNVLRRELSEAGGTAPPPAHYLDTTA